LQPDRTSKAGWKSRAAASCASISWLAILCWCWCWCWCAEWCGCCWKLGLAAALWFVATKMGSRNTVGPPLSTTKPLAAGKGAKSGIGGATPYDDAKGEYGVGCGWNIAFAFALLFLPCARAGGSWSWELGAGAGAGELCRGLLLLASEVAGVFSSVRTFAWPASLARCNFVYFRATPAMKGPARPSNPCQSSRPNLRRAVGLCQQMRPAEEVLWRWCSADRWMLWYSGFICWPCRLTRSWAMGASLRCLLLFRASPATSAIRTTNRKCQVGTPYSAWRRKFPDPRCRLGLLSSGSASPAVVVVSLLRCSSCQSFSTVLCPSAQELLQPFVSVVRFRVPRLFHVVESVLGDNDVGREDCGTQKQVHTSTSLRYMRRRPPGDRSSE
jgi:hypothetical protein